MTEAPRENLTRSVPFQVERADETEDGYTLAGYAAVWDSPTHIDSHEGRFDEEIARGAFRKTIRERTPVLMFNHGRHSQIGDIPIGKITQLREDDRGLFVEARLARNSLVEPVREAIAMGAIDGMSFRFAVVKDKWSKDGSQRILQEVRLAELGPVVFPAYADTSVGVRSLETPTGPVDIPSLARALAAQPGAIASLMRALSDLPEPAPATRENDALSNEAANGESTPSGEPQTTQEPATATPRSTRRDRIEKVARLTGVLTDDK